MRLKPAPESPAIATLAKGTVLNSYGEEGAWFRLVLPPGKDDIVLIGYIAKSEVEILEQKIKKAVDFWLTEKEGFKGVGLHLTLLAGWAMIPSGDIHKGADGLFNIGADTIVARGADIIGRDVKDLHLGANLGGDIIYDLSPTIGIGIGFGYIHAMKIDKFRYRRKIYEYTMESVTDLTVTTFRLGAAYAVSLGRLFKLRFNAGPAVFRVNIDYVRNAADLGFMESYNVKAKSTNLGYQGGVTLETRFLERVSLFFKIQGRSVKVTDFKGFEILGGWEENLAFPEATNAGNLYFIPGHPYPRLAVLPEGVSDAPGARKAVFDFTGADL